MAGEYIKFDVRTEPDLNGFAFAVGRFAERVGDWHQLLEGFGELFKGEMRRQFATEGGNEGGWAPLTDAYAAWKEAHFPGRPIGVLRGYLRSGMTGGEGYTQTIGKTEASYGLGSGPATVYGRFFDEKRKVIAFSDTAPQRWQKLTQEWLTDLAAEAGWK
jgi:hypothetical protein